MGLEVDIRYKLKDFQLSTRFSAENERLGILGASGSGKSMTLRCIAGITTPDEGRIVLNGRVMFDSSKKINLPIRERKVGFLFQNYALFPHLTVSENIGFGITDNKTQRAAIIKEKIEMMHLDGLEKRYPAQLSGGQQQRVALARALAANPDILLLDEPFSALDEYLRKKLMTELLETLRKFNKTTLFVTHNIEEAFRLCDRIAVYSKGCVDALEEKHKLFHAPPTLESALLTGCKNISKARMLGPDAVFAEDWGITLQLAKKPATAPAYVGYRANYIRSATPEDTTNVFDVQILNVAEGPFTVIVRAAFSDDERKSKLQWEMPKKTWEAIQDTPAQRKIHFEPENIILI